MVKKLLLLFTFLFFFNISNVFAYQLPSAYTGVEYVDDSYQDGTTTLASWWGTNNYLASPFRLGYFTSATAEAKKIQFLWSNLNLCPNQNLKISGKIGALYNFFTENPYYVSIFNNNNEMTCSFVLEDDSRISYTCVGTGGGNFYIALSQLSFASHNNYEVAVSRDVDYSCEVTNLQVMQQEIINTQNIINNQNQNTNTITQNQDENTQDIINNQNQNTQDILDDNKKHFETCSPLNYLSYSNLEQGSLDNTGGKSTSIRNLRVRTASNITLSSGTYVLTSSDMEVVVYRFNSNGTVYQSDVNQSWHSSPYTFTLNEDGFVRIAFRFPNSSAITPTDVSNLKPTLYNPSSTDEECINKLDEQTNAINDLNDTLKNDTPPDTENQLNDLESDLISDTPITDLITLPISLINSYITGFSGSCSPYNLGNLYGTDLILPCLNLEQRLGSNLWTIIDSLFSIFMIYNIAMLMIQAFEGFTSLRDDYEGLYQPRHADVGYQPKHGGGN